MVQQVGEVIRNQMLLEPPKLDAGLLDLAAAGHQPQQHVLHGFVTCLNLHFYGIRHTGHDPGGNLVKIDGHLEAGGRIKVEVAFSR